MLKRNEFAALCEVTGQAITAARQNGLIRMTEDGLYDPRDEKNHEYIKAALTRGKKRRRRDSLSQTDDNDDEKGQLEIRELQEKIRYTTERADERALMNAKRKGVLLERDAVLEYASAYSAGVRTYLLPIGTRIAPRITAAVKSGSDVEEVQGIIESEVADAIERSLSMGDSAMQQLVDTLSDPDEEEQTDDDIDIDPE